MKKNLTELVFILDKSGSMHGLEGDTIGGYNSLLEKQKAVEGEAVITTALFNDGYELLHDRIDIQAVNPITESEYRVGGCTALVDAIGNTLHKIDNAQRNTAEDFRAEKVLCVIITDGQENASREFTADKVKALVEQYKEKGWEFIFLGANIDAIETASHYGIAPSRAQGYVATEEGTALNYEAVCHAAEAYRVQSSVPDDWNEEIDSLFKRRKRK